MGNHQFDDLEKRRKIIIDKLIAFQVFELGSKGVFELTLQELEEAYKKVLLQGHPHGDFGSLKWINKKRVN